MENSCAIIQTSAVNWSVKYTKCAVFPSACKVNTSWGDSGPFKLSHFPFQQQKNDESKKKQKKKTFDLFQLTYLN